MADENVSVPRELLDRVLTGAEQMARSAQSIEALESQQRDIRDDIHAIRTSIQGDAEKAGLIERVNTLEREFGVYKRAVWIAVAVVIGIVTTAAVRSLAGEVVKPTEHKRPE